MGWKVYGRGKKRGREAEFPRCRELGEMKGNEEAPTIILANPAKYGRARVKIASREEVRHKEQRPLKVFKAWVRGFFQGKMFIRNISGYKDVIETKFGTWTDFTVLNIFKRQWHFCMVTWRDTFPENFTTWGIANGFSRKHQIKQLFRCKTIISNLSCLEWTSRMS